MVSKIKSFTDLEAWRESRKLVKFIYDLTSTFPKEETYALIDQVRRAAISISANLAEGFGMRTYKDKLRYYYMSQGSINELKSHLIISKDLKYLTKEELEDVAKTVKYVHALVFGLIKATAKNKKDL